MIRTDDDILIEPCHGGGRMHRLAVDDFDDPWEWEITAEQIHLTVLRMGGAREEPVGCFSLSATSARTLVAELQAAIRRREVTP